MSRYVLKLYVTGQTPRSKQAIKNLNGLLASEPALKDYSLEIINIFDNLQLATDEKIVATPTLIRELPPPVKRIVGDLSDKERVLMGLDISSGDKNDV